MQCAYTICERKHPYVSIFRNTHKVEPKTQVEVIAAQCGKEDLQICGAGQSPLHQWLLMLQTSVLVHKDGILEVEDLAKLVMVVEQQLSHRQVYGLVGLEEIASKIGFLPMKH